MEPGVALDGLAAVRVAVVPVGDISDERFATLAGHVASVKDVPLSALPRKTAPPAQLSSRGPGSAESQQLSGAISTFANLPGLSTASTGPISTTGVGLGGAGSSSAPSVSYTSAPAGILPSSPEAADMSSVRLRYEIVQRDHTGMLDSPVADEWGGFHPSKKIWGVIGIVSAKSAEEQEREAAIFEARKQFSAALANFRTAVVSRVIVFSPPVAELERNPTKSSVPGGSQNPVSLQPKDAVENSDSRWISIGFVPDTEPQDTSVTIAEVRAQLHHFVTLVLDVLESWTRRANLTTGMVLSPLDAQHSVEKAGKLQKRRQGRLDKLYGDYFLLMGSPAEALAKYTASAERARANSDRLWLAGALEGAVTAQMLRPYDLAGVDRAIEQYSEIYKLYQKKRTPDLEANAAMRLAEFLYTVAERRQAALAAASHCGAVAEELPPAQQRPVWAALAKFFNRMGCNRKAALFLHNLALSSSSRGMHVEAHALAMASAAKFDRGQWPSLHRALVLEAAASALDASSATDATITTVKALAITLDPGPSQLGERGSRYFGSGSDGDILRRIGSVPVVDLHKHVDCLVYAESATPLRTPDLKVTVSTGVSKGDQKTRPQGPFIYSAMDAEKSRADAERADRVVTWLKDEKATLAIQLRGSCLSKIRVEVVAVVATALEKAETCTEGGLTADHIPLKEANRLLRVVPEVFYVPSRQDRQSARLHVSVTPREEGTFRISSVVVALFGSFFELPIPDGEENSGTISVVPRIPLASITTSIAGGQRTPDGAFMMMYEGEQSNIVATICNLGPGVISSAEVCIDSSENIISCSGAAKSELDVIAEGDSRVIDFAIQAVPSRMGTKCLSREEQIAISVRYTGSDHSNIVRVSNSSLSLIVVPAVLIERASSLKLSDNTAFVLELSNPVAGPMDVRLRPVENENDFAAVSNQFNLPSALVLEPGGSIHLMAPLIPPLVSLEKSVESRLVLHWNAESLGRRGTIPLRNLTPICSAELRAEFCRIPIEATFEINRGPRIHVDTIPKLITGSFHHVTIRLENHGPVSVVNGSRVGTNVLRDDGRGELMTDSSTTVVGCVDGYGWLPHQTVDNAHTYKLKVKFMSAGVFALQIVITFQNRDIVQPDFSKTLTIVAHTPARTNSD